MLRYLARLGTQRSVQTASIMDNINLLLQVLMSSSFDIKGRTSRDRKTYTFHPILEPRHSNHTSLRSSTLVRGKGFYVGTANHFLKAVLTSNPSKIIRLAVSNIKPADQVESFLGLWLRAPSTDTRTRNQARTDYPVLLDAFRRKVRAALTPDDIRRNLYIP